LEKAHRIDQSKGMEDASLFQAVTGVDPLTENYSVCRTSRVEKPRYTDTYITLTTSQMNYPLIHRFYAGEDRETIWYQ